MTREEAKALLLNISAYDIDTQRGMAKQEAIEMAIKVLEQEPCDNCISRQAVLDAMYALCDTGETLKENPWRDNPHIDAVTDVINNLPSVNSQPCGDCISRQAAIDLADELKDDLPDDDHLSDMVMSHNEGILEYQTKLSLLPPVTPAKKVGRWTHDGSHWENRFICSECGYKLFDEQTNYCPNCGSYNGGDDNGNE